MCTDNEQVEIKSDPGTPEQDPAVGTHVEEEGKGNDASLNTSEVTFRPREEEVTYKEVMRVDKGLDSEIDEKVSLKETFCCPCLLPLRRKNRYQ